MVIHVSVYMSHLFWNFPQCINLTLSAHYDEGVVDYIGKIEHYPNHRLPDGLESFNL